MIQAIIILIKKLFLLPHFLWVELLDLIKYIQAHGWERFEGWGMHLYVGMFGAGKTSTLVHDAYNICKQYPQVSVLSNFALYDFPEHTKIYPLKTVEDILSAPDNTLVLIDEIGTVFNSRDFLGGKGVPKILFQHICQCRKRHIEILATTQRWNFLDKQLRDITATVTSTRVAFKHPFSRMATARVYDAVEYDLSYTNPAFSPPVRGNGVYIQTDALRNRYDTTELVETMLASSYLDDDTIMRNRGEAASTPTELSKQSSRRIKNRKV